MDEELFNLPVEAEEDEFPLTPPDQQAAYDPEATLALSEALPAPSQIAPSPSPPPSVSPPAAETSAAAAAVAAANSAQRSRHELDVDATMDALLDEMFPSPQPVDEAADPSLPPAHPPSPSLSPPLSPPPSPPARVATHSRAAAAAAAAPAAAASPAASAAHPAASKPRPSLAALLAGSIPVANTKPMASSAKASNAKSSTGSGGGSSASSSGGAAAADASGSAGVAQFRSIFPDVSEGRAQQLIEACTGNVSKAIDLFLAQGEAREGGTTRPPPQSQASQAAAAAAPASSIAAAAAAASSSPALPAWSTRAVKRPRSDDQTPSPSPEPSPEPAAAAAAARSAPSASRAAAASASDGTKVKSERKAAPSRAHRSPDGASSSAAAGAAAAAAPSSPVPAAASSSDSSILSRLEAKERASRARPFADGNVHEELVLADGSVTDDAASGLRAAVPASINSRLREYQRDGIRFLFDRWREQLGGLLGDEMGLGKSIQTIGLLAALFSMKRVAVDDEHAAAAAAPAAAARAPSSASVKPVMLIAPATILLQWQQELHDWCPQLQVRIMHSAEKAAALDLARSCRLHVLITSYETCQSQINAIRNIDWSLAILDECHRLKNPEIKSTIRMRQRVCVRKIAHQRGP